MANERIMVVEDEWVIADDIQKSLRNLGYTVSSIVPTGEGAIQKAEEDKPDLVLMDIILQGEMDGIEAARQIHTRFNIPVIYLTAFADQKLLERAKITEPFGYMLKPFEDRTLHSNIEISLFKHKMEKRLRESEEKYRGLIETAQDSIICIDEKGIISVWNQLAEKVFGYSKSEMIGQQVTNIIPERYKRKHQEGIRRFLQTGKTRIIGKTVEVSGMTKEGIEVPIEISLSFHKLGEAPYTFTGIIRDITSRKKTEGQLVEKTKEVERINKELGDFVYIISHDLKEPLFSIEGFTKRLFKVYGNTFDEKGKSYIDRIKANIKMLSDRIYEIMEVVKIGTVEYDFTDNDSGAIVKDVIKTLESKIESNKVNVIIQDNLPTVCCDAKRLRDVFFNLTTNAIKFMGDDNLPNSPVAESPHNPPFIKGGKRGLREIRIGCDKDEDKYKFFVEDTGIGIQPEHHEHIFKMFKRLKVVEAEGSGVGLAIVKKIVELHKGKIWVESPVEDGRGARFCFTMPIEPFN